MYDTTPTKRDVCQEAGRGEKHLLCDMWEGYDTSVGCCFFLRGGLWGAHNNNQPRREQ